jgi:glycosyltransferase involved in cell wall biosynthesis
MYLVQINPAISNEASGPSYSTVRLSQALIEAGNRVTLAVLDWEPVLDLPEFVKPFPIASGPKRLGRSPAMRRWLAEECRTGNVEVLHNHGMWDMTALYSAWVKQGQILVHSPRGTLSTWAMAQGSPAKGLSWPLLQRPALKQATCLHATAETEYEDIRRWGFTQPVAIIPNGVDLPSLSVKKAQAHRTLLFLGRIHPKKGLDLLLPTWQVLQDRFPEWRLRIVGSDSGYYPASGYLNQLQKLAEQLGLERITFDGALYGDQKWQAYGEADLFVLPTYSENFGIAVAESLGAGTPVVVSKGAPWSVVPEHGAGWWVDIGLDPLIAGLEEALGRSSPELALMGQRGRALIQEHYSWPKIADQMAQTYHWLQDRSLLTPAWVRAN